MTSDIEPFAVRDCALIAIATGKRAQNLRELRELLREIDLNCIYYHFWGGLLRPRFDDPEYHNDFAIWIAHSLHNKILSERLAVIDPVAYESLEELRSELIDIIEESLDETEYPIWANRDDQFEFIRSQTVVFDANIAVKQPAELIELLPRMSPGSIFFHFIDGRRRNANGMDDFSNWLFEFGAEHQKLIESIQQIDPYFSSLRELRRQLAKIFAGYFERETGD